MTSLEEANKEKFNKIRALLKQAVNDVDQILKNTLKGQSPAKALEDYYHAADNEEKSIALFDAETYFWEFCQHGEEKNARYVKRFFEFLKDDKMLLEYENHQTNVAAYEDKLKRFIGTSSPVSKSSAIENSPLESVENLADKVTVYEPLTDPVAHFKAALSVSAEGQKLGKSGNLAVYDSLKKYGRELDPQMVFQAAKEQFDFSTVEALKNAATENDTPKGQIARYLIAKTTPESFFSSNNTIKIASADGTPTDIHGEKKIKETEKTEKTEETEETEATEPVGIENNKHP